MKFSKLPAVKECAPLPVNHFPNRLYATVFRLWETVDASRIANALSIAEDEVRNAAKEMGLPAQANMKDWDERGYITTIRNAWHLLPYEQLLKLLGWSEDKLATVLKEDDFLDVKLGRFKPYCEEVKVEPLTDVQKEQLKNIRETMQKYFSEMFLGAKPFDFFDNVDSDMATESTDGLRMIYSYCGLYAGALDNDISISYPDNLLSMYKAAGINAIWLPVVLYQMIPFAFDESYSEGWQMRQARLKELIKKAGEYGIKVYLYLNEPRCMPLAFFEKYPHLKGRTTDLYAALCTSQPEVLEYLRNGVRALCEAVPEIGGFFVITCSENLTHCKSRDEGVECERCREVPVHKLVADVLCAISEESRAVNPDIKTIAWTWSWSAYMTDSEICTCIEKLPKEIILQCKSEEKKPFIVGGIENTVSDYSMSIPGPSEMSEKIWKFARDLGHEISAKVQVNDTWECSTVPFLPVFDLIREHMSNLRNVGVEHLMLSWTLGGYPSVNLKIASECLINPSEEKYIELLKSEFGEYAESVKKATTLFSDAFREYPFHIDNLYKGPQNAGPSNLLYREPTGFAATMTCYAYDDLDKWRATYPRDIFINQLKKVCDGWMLGLKELDDIPDCLFKQAAWGGYALFYSSYLQSEFIDKRQSGDKEHLINIIEEEKKTALLMYDIMQKSSLFGYEAANHYYFNKGMLAEKVLNCEQLKCAIRNDN